MTRVIIDMAMSLDGFVAGPDQGPDAPLGLGGQRLHEWMFASDAFAAEGGDGVKLADGTDLADGDAPRDGDVLGGDVDLGDGEDLAGEVGAGDVEVETATTGDHGDLPGLGEPRRDSTTYGPDSAGPAALSDGDVVREHFTGVGAYVMGRQMFGGGPGPWSTEEPWNGWWGDEPPYGCPVFVVTHHAREPLHMAGGTTFTFVTEGPEAALALAKEAAGGGDVRVAGGASIANQLLAAGAIDQVQVHVSPAILGRGERLFAGLTPESLHLTIDRVVASETVTHLRYRVG